MTRILVDGPAVTVVPPHVTVLTVHDPDACAGRACVVHAPTEHTMRSLPLHWRSDRGIFERLCEHGIGHPDPDQRDYWREQAERGEIRDETPDEHGCEVQSDPDEWVAAQLVHGCDGCCAGAYS